MIATNPIPWEQLLTDIHKRQVLPIIGPALVTVDEGGLPVPLIRAIVPDFCSEHGIENKPGMTLHEAACDFLVQSGQHRRREMYNTVSRLVSSRSDEPLPQPLLDLATITDFDVFITTTFDGFLTRAISEQRPGWTPEKGRRVLHPAEIVDAPQPLPSTLLYHILGACDQYTSFAIWEEDYMEYLAALLMGPKDNLRHLIGLLRNRSLLLIGSPFDDWFVRFFLFIAKRSKIAAHNDTTGAYLAADLNSDDPLVFYFDKVMGLPRVLPIEPGAFVAELRQRWEAKFALAPLDLIASLPTDMPRGYVFISYASEDKEAAFNLALGLHNAGIPVWLDKVRLQAGSDWEAALRLAVKQRAALFISLISAVTESFPEKPTTETQRFVMRERDWAADRHETSLVFYVPALISPGTNTQHREPEVFRRLQCAKIPGGRANPAFIARITAYMDEYREKGEISHAP